MTNPNPSTSPMTTETTEQLIQQGWADHADDAPGVLARLDGGVDAVDAPGPVPALAALIVHVAGEHLGRWAEGLALLDRLAARPAAADPAAAQAVRRARATLRLCAGEAEAAEADLSAGHPGGDRPLASTRARVLAVAASALAGQGRPEEAAARFGEAIELTSYGPTAADPAARALAVTGNNLACELEERPGRTPADDALLELAARTARRFWEVAGDWRNVQLAEYRLAMTFLALDRPADALTAAEAAVALGEAAADATADDQFFAHEALARARHAAGDAAGAAAAREAAAETAAAASADLAAYVAETLSALDADLAR